MATTDGISDIEWDVVLDYAVAIANAAENDRPQLRRQLLDYLGELELKYGAVPSILATRADYVDADDPERESLLLRAHAAARSTTDLDNALHVAHSLCELYLENCHLSAADRWLTTLRDHLTGRDDCGYRQEYERLRAVYRSVVIVDAGGGTVPE